MRIKLLTNVWLRICMIVAVVTTAFAGTAWANEPVTVALEEFTATNDVHLDGNVHYTTTGTLENGMIKVPFGDTFTVSVTNGLITSVSVVSATASGVRYQANNVNEPTHIWNVQPDVPITVTSSGCSSVTFTNEVNAQGQEENYPFTVCYLSVTYVPSELDGWTLRAKTNNTPDQIMGTTKVNGNVVMATPGKGYGYAETAYTVTPATAVVEHVGNTFTVTSVPEGTTDVEVTVNFAPHATDNKINFESDLANYSDWTFSNIVRNDVNQDSNTRAHNGRRYGKATATTASITTANPIQYPHIFSCWGAKMEDYVPSATWTIEVSTDKSSWTEVGKKTFAENYPKNNWDEFSANLSGYTNVYVRLSYSANAHGYNTQTCVVDDIDLTEEATPINPEVTITSAGYATFVPAYNVSLPEGLTAYKVTGATSTSVTMVELTTVPAGTPVVLKGSPKTYNLPVVENANAVSGNLLEVSNGSVEGNGTSIYVLANKSNGVGFYRMASGQKIPAGKAYLVISAGIKEFYGFDDDATGIEVIDNGQLTIDNEIYNLAGQRLSMMQKGINIVNGKKILK